MQNFTISGKIILLLPVITVFHLYCDAQKKDFFTEQQLDLSDFIVSTCGNSTRLAQLIQKTIKNDTANKTYFFRTVKLANPDFKSLAPVELFMYAHQYPESYSQNCSFFHAPNGLEKLYANLPSISSGVMMSKRQEESLKNNRDSTIRYLGDCIKKKNYVALAYKQTILGVNAWELVPLILSIENKMYNQRDLAGKDTYLYTLMMKLMHDNSFADFKKAEFYDKLYGADRRYSEAIDFSTGIRNQLVKLAEDFYLQKTSETK